MSSIEQGQLNFGGDLQPSEPSEEVINNVKKGKPETDLQKRLRIAEEAVKERQRLDRIEEEGNDSKVGSRYY